jgi:hypothetical protein
LLGAIPLSWLGWLSAAACFIISVMLCLTEEISFCLHRHTLPELDPAHHNEAGARHGHPPSPLPSGSQRKSGSGSQGFGWCGLG